MYSCFIHVHCVVDVFSLSTKIEVLPVSVTSVYFILGRFLVSILKKIVVACFIGKENQYIW
jgi:hypothetical protein